MVAPLKTILHKWAFFWFFSNIVTLVLPISYTLTKSQYPKSSTLGTSTYGMALAFNNLASLISSNLLGTLKTNNPYLFM